MDFELNEEQKLMQDMARRFARETIAPISEKDEEEHKFRPELVRQMGELGFFGCLIPEEYGGNGAGEVASVVITEEIACVSPSYGLPFNMQAHGTAKTILRYGNEEQKKKYIPGLASAEKFGCFAITEPGAGSDVVSMLTTAVEDGDHFVLNGQKTWISNAHVADIGLVYAMTDKSRRHKGMSCFIVDLKETDGITTRPIETKLGLYSAPTGEIFFEDARVPKENLLGEVNHGFKICMSMLDNTRLSCAARAVGVGRASFEVAKEYAEDRKQFGKPIIKFPQIRDDLAEMYLENQAARLLLWRAAQQKDNDPNVRNSLEVSVAKYFAAEAAVKAANDCVKILGSYGFSTEYRASRLLRDAKSFQIVEGTSNIQKLVIGNNILGK
ncbi:MAG: acyl-CoA dehydrogenase [Deltaproteobacteria bacterium]|nr:acyl-CoA dehydrogenase [Deltaproteobacteria bacterium]